MLQPYRRRFNKHFSSAKYGHLLDELEKSTRTRIQFRVAETPCFFSKEMIESWAFAGYELTQQLLKRPEYLQLAAEAIPPGFRVPNLDSHPHFMTVDFGLVKEDDGSLRPKLVEMQAFPSVYGYQDVLAKQYVKTYGLAPELNWLLGGHTDESYWNLLRDIIVGDHDPKNVILMEVAPQRQKTLPDFNCYQDRLGVANVDIASIRKDGRRLLYERDGRWIRIERIFNRAIVDEIQRENVRLQFDPRDEIDVEWAGHPNWYFLVSKFSLPFLDHPSVPKAVFLDEWFKDPLGSGLPVENNNLLLKPLYSFAGKGIQFAPTRKELEQIPVAERSQFLLQERVKFEPTIETPYGLTQAEVRIMYLWPDEGAMQPVISLVRLGRGLMMGVDHNKGQEWVGGSAALFPLE